MTSMRLLVAALCVAAVACAAAEPETTWTAQVADAADLVARSSPLHTFTAPARAASAAIGLYESIEEDESTITPESDFEEVDGWLAATAKGKGKSPKKAAAKSAPKAKKAAPKVKKTVAKKPTKAKDAAKKKKAPKEGAKKAAAEKPTSQKGINKVAKKAAKKAAINKGDDDAKVKALKATVAAMKADSKADKEPTADETTGATPHAAPMAHKKEHIKILERGKLHLPKHFHVPSKAQTKKEIAEDTPAAIHTDKEYWKLKQLRAEYRYKKGYETMRENLLRKELRRHYASKLVRD